MLGLLISDSLKSVVAIYIIVPFLLVPQILLAGVIVKFDKLHYKFASNIVVPLSGDLMASRWAYEALAVNQFANNAYQKPLFETEMLESNINYDLQFLIPALTYEIEDAMLFRNENRTEQLSACLKTIKNALASISLTTPYPFPEQMEMDQFSESAGREAITWLQKYQAALRSHRDQLIREKDLLIDSLIQIYGGSEAFIQLKRNYYNEQLALLALNRNDLYKIVKKEGTLVRKMDPVYAFPAMKNGRAHFFASVKILGNKHIQTLHFNMMAIWMMTLLLSLFLRFRLLKKGVEFTGNLWRKRSAGG
jgi:hypothetical protein